MTQHILIFNFRLKVRNEEIFKAFLYEISLSPSLHTFISLLLSHQNDVRWLDAQNKALKV